MSPYSKLPHRSSTDAAPPREFTATVTEIRELRRIEGRPVFQLALDRSEFAPAEPLEGCVGTLTATSRLGAVLIAPVLSVDRDDRGELWHTTMKPLQPGTQVRASIQQKNHKLTEQ